MWLSRGWTTVPSIPKLTERASIHRGIIMLVILIALASNKLCDLYYKPVEMHAWPHLTA